MDRTKQLFLSLIQSFQMQAMMQLGKMKNPITDSVEKDLDAAQISIDILEAIKVKTQGNLEKDESDFLEHILADLKLNFIAEKEKPGGVSSEDNDSGSNGESKIITP